MLAPLTLVIAVLTAQPAAPAERGREAQAAMERAVALHDEGKLDEASAVLDEAYAVYPDRDFLFMRGVVERKRNNCELAVDLFESFLAQHPSLVDVEAANAQIESCKASAPEPAAQTPPPAAAQEAAPEPPPATVEPDYTPPTPADSSSDRGPHWKNDALAGGLLGTGLVLSTAGAVLLVAADRQGSNANGAPTAGDYRQERSRARSLSAVGWPALGLGVSALVGSVIRYAVVARRHREAAQ